MRWILVVAILTLAGCSVSAGSDGGKTDATAAIKRTTTTTESTTTTTTTRPKPTTSTTEPPTTTTTYDLAADVAKDRAAATDLLNSNRTALADAIEADSNVSSVDSLTIEGDTVRVSVTSGYSTLEYQVDEAWAVYRAMATLWNEDDGILVTPIYAPALAFTNNIQSYTCSADFMRRLASAQADRSAWEAEC